MLRLVTSLFELELKVTRKTMTSSNFIIFIVLGWLSIHGTNGSDNKLQVDFESHTVRSHTTKQGQKVVVLDELFSQSTLEALQTLILENSPWEIHNDQEFPNQKQQRKPGKGDLDLSEAACSREEFPWSVQIPSAVFTKFNIWKHFKEYLQHVTEIDDFQPFEIAAQMLQRGTNLNATCGVDTSMNPEYIIRLFLTPDWGKNDYGDLTLFETDTDPGVFDRVLLNVNPKYGRVVMWDASIPYLSHPPSMSYLQELLFITIRCTRDGDKMKESQKTVEKKLIERESSQFFRFPKLKEKPMSKSAMSQKEVRRFHDQDGRVVAIFDNLFSSEDVDNLKTYATHQGPNFLWQAFDTELEETEDNVKWIKKFEPEDFVHSQWWKVIADLAKYVSGNHGNWYPYDVALNVAVPTDHTRVHEDCQFEEDEYTFLIYLNSKWTAEKLGETTFFDRLSDEEVSQNLEEEYIDLLSKYNSIGAVKPQYGRAVLFQGTIPHSARPPVSTYQGMRLSFAVKMAATRKLAIAKRLREEIEDYPGGMTEDEEKLVEELFEGSMKRELSSRSEKWLMGELNKYVVKTDEYQESQAMKARGVLMAR